MAQEDKGQTEGRTDNAAQPQGAGTSSVKPEAYPPAGRDDAVRPRALDNPRPPQGAGDGGPSEDLSDPAGDPAEGKR